MPGICYNPYGCEWSIAQIWRSIDWLVRADVIILAFMLVHTVVALIRHSYLLHLVARLPRSAPRHVFEGKIAVGIRNVKSIAAVAPLLGEVGTCFGILNAFSGIGMETHAALALISSRVAASLVPSAVGIVVSVAAVWSYNYLQGCVERSDISSRAKYVRAIRPRLPLMKRVSELPAFALMAGVLLTIAALAFMLNAFPYTPVGLPLRLLSKEELIGNQILISVASRAKDNSVALSVSGTRVSGDKLKQMMLTQLKTSPEAVTRICAENDVRWADVADVMDTLHGLNVDIVLVNTPAAATRRKSAAHGVGCPTSP
jgi:hypothetical protein